jgi:hypothetical protein
MFIHFDSEQSTICDNCGTPRTIMHMSVTSSDRSLDLCVTCLRALFQALRHASEKLRLNA